MLLFGVLLVAVIVAAPVVFLFYWLANRESAAHMSDSYLEDSRDELVGVESEIAELNDEGDDEGIRRRQDGSFHARTAKGQALNERWGELAERKDEIVSEVRYYWYARAKASAASKALIVFAVCVTVMFLVIASNGNLHLLTKDLRSFVTGLITLCLPGSVIGGIVFGCVYLANWMREPPLLSALDGEET